MRLVIVTNDFPPKPGGIQMYLRNLVDAYPDQTLVVAPRDERAVSESGVVRSRHRFMLPTAETRRFVLEAVEGFAGDAVLFGAPHPLAQMGSWIRERSGVPFGVLSHGAEVTIPGAVPVARRMLGRTLAAADVRFAVSRFTGRSVRRLSGKEVDFLGAGVEVDTFTPPPSPPDNPKPVIGCVSRFVPRKGQHRLIEAAAKLDREVQLLFVGSGRKERHLRSLADRNGVDARFEVDVDWAELPGLYQSMDVFCMPCRSRWGGLEVEGLGLVFLEAAASGLPVLAGDSGGSPETVLPGETGFVVARVDDIVEGLEILLDDPDRARRMGAAGRRFVEREFTWERVIERLVSGFAPYVG